MSLKAINKNILIRIIPEEEKGIISGEEVNIVKGNVLSIGSAVNPQLYATTSMHTGIYNEIKHDDIVWFNKFDAINLPFDEELYVVDKENIIVVEEEDEQK